ncbi:hypothetical protein VTN00DRAFT_6238 [Thermoascus crustaceus]|uniref:uncharacterized protein n=1 Tax=Thermoascus crustaceus TaxID=5088 RepID=UPI0037430C30
MDATIIAQTQPLADRSTNTRLQSSNGQNGDLKPDVNSMEYHRQALQAKLASGEQSQGTYVSPSDDIMSPCTKKLSDLKGKRFKNVGKPQSLFAKLGKKSFEKSSSSSSLDEGGSEGSNNVDLTGLSTKLLGLCPCSLLLVLVLVPAILLGRRLCDWILINFSFKPFLFLLAF